MKNNTPEGAVRCPDGTFLVEPVMPMGRLDAEALETITSVVKRFGLPGVRLTAAQRLMIEGIPEDRVEDVISALGGVCGTHPLKISACRGRGNCRRGVKDTYAMAERLEALVAAVGKTPAKLKAGLSGCNRCCGGSYIRDIGLVGTAGGWTLVFGGNGGRRVRCGDELLTGASDEQVLEALGALLAFYRREAEKGERTARFVERIGVAALLRVLHGKGTGPEPTAG